MFFHFHFIFFSSLFWAKWLTRRNYIFCVDCSGLSLVTNICMSFGFGCFGGGDPSILTGIRSLVGLACCMVSCGIINSFGLIGDFGDRGSGVGGSISINIGISVAANDTFGRFGIGLSNGGVCLFGISTVHLSSCEMTFTKTPALYPMEKKWIEKYGHQKHEVCYLNVHW